MDLNELKRSPLQQVEKPKHDPLLARIRLYPNPILKKMMPQLDTRPSLAPGMELQKYLVPMLEFCQRKGALGVAANQMGFEISVCVVRFPNQTEPMVMVNPEMLSSGGRATDGEGCFSAPGIGVRITRAEWVVVKWLDRDLFPKEQRFEALEARIIQHELDHLQGLCIVDKMTPVDRTLHGGALKKLFMFEKMQRQQLAAGLRE